jgi:hypothetical protein
VTKTLAFSDFALRASMASALIWARALMDKSFHKIELLNIWNRP